MPQRRPKFASSSENNEKTSHIIVETNIPPQIQTQSPDSTEPLDGSIVDDSPSSISNNIDPQEIEPLKIDEPRRMKGSNGSADASGQHHRRIRNWKESPFAVGLTEPTWYEERTRSVRLPDDESGCLWCSAYVCSMLGAGRVGNMAVLRSSTETVEIVVDDEETGQQSIQRVRRPQLDIVVGPYWPMLCFVTYPLILGVSGWTFITICQNGLPAIAILLWTACTLGLIVSLALTGCRDPGILHKVRTLSSQHQHPNANTTSWRWTDQADSYRPRNAWYDNDTAVIVEGFDHTCPWTGTAIGKKNMLAFQFFVCLVFVCMIMDIFILTGSVK